MNVSQSLRLVYAACLLGAAYNHAVIMFSHGIYYDFGGRPWPICAFWTSLTVIDPAVAIALFVWSRLGVVSTGVLIVSDVIVNAAVALADGQRLGFGHSGYLMLAEQVAFMIFVLLTLPFTNSSSSSARSRAR